MGFKLGMASVSIGVMHEYLMSWLQASEDQSGVAFDSVDWAFGGLLEMAENFLCLGQPMSGVAYGDEDVESWGFEGDRWARMVTAGLLPVHKQLKLVEVRCLLLVDLILL